MSCKQEDNSYIFWALNSSNEKALELRQPNFGENVKDLTGYISRAYLEKHQLKINA